MDIKKRISFLFLLVFTIFSISAFSFEEIRDIEKIRWINSGEGHFEFSESDKVTFSFSVYPSIRYLKTYDVVKNVYYTGESYSLKQGWFHLLYEYKEKYFVPDMSEEHYNYLVEQNDSYFLKKKGYSLGRYELDNPNIYVREDGKEFSVDDICCKYLKIEDKELYTIVEKYDNFDYVGTVSITDENQIIRERGKHFILYNPETSTFYSDSLYYDKGYNFENCGNDSFQIRIEKWSEDEKLLVLDTPQYTRPYVPMEDFFTPNTSKVCIEKPYEEKRENIIIYENPDFLSEPIKKFDGNETFFVKIIETTANLVEHEGKISKWVKVKFDDGLEGWVWGRDVILFDSTSGYDPQKVERYVEYNTVK
ncbi:MAG: SH3 domain-containing protein [Spirochaetaceae bacterium]|nr:SH3 domain-containing protein [Spirochaetaceae bacterium]